MQTVEKNYVTFCRNKAIETKELYSVCIHKHYYNVHGLRTRAHERNFSMHVIAAYLTCTQTYIHVHEKTGIQKFSIPAIMILM